MSVLNKWIRKTSRPLAATARKKRAALGVERLEGRELMSHAMISNMGYIQLTPAASGSGGGTLSITGSGSDDVAEVRFTPWNSGRIDVTLNGRTETFDWLTRILPNGSVPSEGVAKIVFNGGNGGDRFTNFTAIPCEAHGDAGDDILIGGRGRDQLGAYWRGGTWVDDADQDTLIGGDENDVLAGGSGNDILRGDAGIDTLWGDAGFDTLWGGTETDYMHGGSEDDLVRGEGGNDILWGDGGKDQLGAYWLNNVWMDDSGSDIMHGGEGDDTLAGGTWGDTLNGDGGLDTLWGDAGKDTLWGGTEKDELHGGTEDDILRGEAGDDILYGEAGNDQLGAYWAATWMDDGGNDVMYGGIGNDTLAGGTGNDNLYGEAGLDSLWGDADNDNLYGGSEADDIHGGVGNDGLFGGTGFDTLNGDAGADRFLVRTGDGDESAIAYKEPQDAVIRLTDSTVTIVNDLGTYPPQAWTDAEIERLDKAFIVLHNEGHTKLIKGLNNESFTFVRHGGSDRGYSGSGIHLTDAQLVGQSDIYLVGYALHEIGHCWQGAATFGAARWDAFQAVSGWTADGSTKSVEIVSDYGMTGVNEDFAKSFSAYFATKNGWEFYNPLSARQGGGGADAAPTKMALMAEFAREKAAT